MIYTVTLNPSIDYVIRIPRFQNGGLNRTSQEQYFPGGKGINVSVVLKNLGVESIALGFVGGFTGEKIVSMLKEKGIKTDFIHLMQGDSRINVKMHSISDEVETEINGSGPRIQQQEISKLKDSLCKLKQGDKLVLAGGVPPSIPSDIYENICAWMQGKQVDIIVDAEKQLLKKVLKYRPFLIKPNHHELGQMFGVELQDKEEAIYYAKMLQEYGARNIIVSMAEQGAVFVGEGKEVYRMDAPKGKVINSVGAGDSMVAGFLAACEQMVISGMEGNPKCTERNSVMEEAFYRAVCSGSACAFLDGLPQYEDIEKVLTESKRN